MNLGIIGYGYWGPNLVRNFSSISECTIKTVSDFRLDRLQGLKKNYPSVHITSDADEIFNDPDISAVIIATPTFSHYQLAKKALLQNKHVLIEKPMTTTSAEAEELINIAQQRHLTLMVDHTFLYTGAVRKMKQLIENGEIGKINYFDSTRINLGLFQPDINVLWDLAPHDISILNYLIGETPVSVNATGVSHTNNGIENIAYMSLNYQSGLIAHFNCSWTSPVKIRMTLLGGTKKMIVYNDMEPTEKIKIYDTGYDHKITEEEKQRILVDYRVGDVFIPKLETSEALAEMAKDFISSINKKTKPISDFNVGINVVKILEASQKSIKNKGQEILIN